MKKVLTCLFALIFTVGLSYAQSNDAVIEQADLSNDASITQAGSNNLGFVGQGRAETYSQDPGTAEHNTATLTQSGSGNEALIGQGYGDGGGAAEGNTATVTQTGNSNATAPGQGTYGGTAINNSFNVQQTGDFNYAGVRQGFNGATSVESNASVSQTGSDNWAQVTQSGFDHQATVRNPGDVNNIVVNQSGGDVGALTGGANRVDLYLRGDGNDLNVNQEGNGQGVYLRANTGRNDDNVMDIDQFGDNNEMGLSIQPGSDRNQIFLEQDGSGNRIGHWGGGNGVKVEGDDNVVNALQTGNDHSASIQVSGSLNTATVVQGN